MKIIKFKKNKNGSYTLFLENEEELTVYEEVILKYELLLNKKIDDKKRQQILSENVWWDTYYQALKMIKVKARTAKEIEEELLKKGYSKENLEEVLKKLKDQKYLDDKRYADSYIHTQMITTSWGPKKIKDKLKEKGISNEEIEEVIPLYTKEVESEKVNKLVSKMVRSNHTKSTQALKQKIKNTLYQEGFNPILIQEAIENTQFEEETSLREKEYNKLKKRLMHKYNGEELEQQIRRRLYQKGFTPKE